MFPEEFVSFPTFVFAIATIAIFISVLIMKLTRNPVNESKYKTTRAVIKQERYYYIPNIS